LEKIIGICSGENLYFEFTVVWRHISISTMYKGKRTDRDATGSGHDLLHEWSDDAPYENRKGSGDNALWALGDLNDISMDFDSGEQAMEVVPPSNSSSELQVFARVDPSASTASAADTETRAATSATDEDVDVTGVLQDFEEADAGENGRSHYGEKEEEAEKKEMGNVENAQQQQQQQDVVDMDDNKTLERSGDSNDHHDEGRDDEAREGDDPQWSSDNDEEISEALETSVVDCLDEIGHDIVNLTFKQVQTKIQSMCGFDDATIHEWKKQMKTLITQRALAVSQESSGVQGGSSREFEPSEQISLPDDSPSGEEARKADASEYEDSDSSDAEANGRKVTARIKKGSGGSSNQKKASAANNKVVQEELQVRLLVLRTSISFFLRSDFCSAPIIHRCHCRHSPRTNTSASATKI
jgi:hypothetical protein